MARAVRRARAWRGRGRALWLPRYWAGDTDSTTGPITISIAALGAVPQGKMLRRAGRQRRRPRGGHRARSVTPRWACCCGAIWRSPERWGLSREASNSLQQRYHPRAANRASRSPKFSAAHASAAMDLSDGLAGDSRQALPGVPAR